EIELQPVRSEPFPVLQVKVCGIAFLKSYVPATKGDDRMPNRNEMRANVALHLPIRCHFTSQADFNSTALPNCVAFDIRMDRKLCGGLVLPAGNAVQRAFAEGRSSEA